MRIALCLVIPAVLAGPAAALQPQALTAEQWRADLAEMSAAIRETHPDPFHRVDEDAFGAAVAALDAEIPQLSDHAITLRMAAIAGLPRDGHTRLTLPRALPGLEFTTGHSPDPAPADPALAFASLPVRLGAFEDGLHVVDAAPGHGSFAGARVEAIAGLEAGAALEAAARYASHENEGAARLHAADRLALPALLAELGGTLEDCGAPLVLARDDEAETACLPVLQTAAGWPAMAEKPAREGAPYRIEPDAPEGIVLVVIDEIANDPGQPIGAFIEAAVARAEAENARLVIDLRRNTGGNSDLNRGVVTPILASAEINAWGRLYALTGPKTFSAAQTLLNELQRYSRALFVGAPSGSAPEHYGDSVKTQLTHSGLTLRVSSLHWDSGVANDPRDATYPHLPVPATAGAALEGRDAALRAAAEFEHPGVVALARESLQAGRVINAYMLVLLDALAPGSEALEPADFRWLGEEFEAEGDDLSAAYSYQIGLQVFPKHETLSAAFEAAAGRL